MFHIFPFLNSEKSPLNVKRRKKAKILQKPTKHIFTTTQNYRFSIFQQHFSAFSLHPAFYRIKYFAVSSRSFCGESFELGTRFCSLLCELCRTKFCVARYTVTVTVYETSQYFTSNANKQVFYFLSYVDSSGSAGSGNETKPNSMSDELSFIISTGL